MEGLPLILARCIMLSLLLKPTDSAQDEVVPCAAPAAPEAGEEVSPASLMKQCRTRSASEWREAGLSPISYVYHQLMHGHGCRHASTVHQLGARPIARPSMWKDGSAVGTRAHSPRRPCPAFELCERP